MGLPKWLSIVGRKAIEGAKIVAEHPDAINTAAGWLGDHGMSSVALSNVDMLETIASKIVDVEIIGQSSNLTGAQKAEAAAKIVAQQLLQSRMLGGHAPADEALFLKGCQSLASGMADILNSRQPQ